MVEPVIITLTKQIHIGSLNKEVMVSSFSSKIDTSKKVSLNGTLKVNLLEALTASDLTELDTIIDDHDYEYNEFMSSNRPQRQFNREEGVKYWDDFSDDLIYKVNNETITLVVAESIYNSAKPIIQHLIIGSWFSAHTEASDLTVTTDFTQTIKDKIVLDMKTFVNANYPESMHIV